MGDGIMALFGAPLANEDYAVRACYTTLRMQESVKQYVIGGAGRPGARLVRACERFHACGAPCRAGETTREGHPWPD
jgi:class 3 adenylate cyclase